MIRRIRTVTTNLESDKLEILSIEVVDNDYSIRVNGALEIDRYNYFVIDYDMIENKEEFVKGLGNFVPIYHKVDWRHLKTLNKEDLRRLLNDDLTIIIRFK